MAALLNAADDIALVGAADPAGATDRVDIEEAVWEGDGASATIVAWRVIRAASPATVRSLSTTADHTSEPPASATTGRIRLYEAVDLDHRHRLRLADGRLFRVDAVASEVGVGLPLVVSVTLVTDA